MIWWSRVRILTEVHLLLDIFNCLMIVSWGARLAHQSERPGMYERVSWLSVSRAGASGWANSWVSCQIALRALGSPFLPALLFDLQPSVTGFPGRHPYSSNIYTQWSGLEDWHATSISTQCCCDFPVQTPLKKKREAGMGKLGEYIWISPKEADR